MSLTNAQHTLRFGSGWNLILVSILLFGSMPASATLVSKDLVPSSGDGLLTLDTSTGLEWLDLTETQGPQGVSVVDIVAGWGGFTTTLGFRYATKDEVIGIWAQAGLDANSGVGNAQDVRLLLNLWGETEPNFSRGVYFSPTNYGDYNYDDLDLSGSFARTDIMAVSPIQETVPFQEVGHHLVRQVPEPGTALLLGSSLLAVGIATRRRAAREGSR